MGIFQVGAVIVSVSAVSCLIMFVILLKDIDPPPLAKDHETPIKRTNFPPEILRRSGDDLHMANMTREPKDEGLNVDRIVEEIVSSSLAQINNASGENIAELSNSILTSLRGTLLQDIKRSIPRIIQIEDEVDKVKTKINTTAPEQSFVTNNDVVAINITDVLGQPLVELKLYSYKSNKSPSKDEDLIMD